MSSKSHYDKEFERLLNELIKGIVRVVITIFHGIRRLPTKKANFIVLFIWLLIGWALIRFRLHIWNLIPTKMAYLRNGVYIGFALPPIYLYYKGHEYKAQKDEMSRKFEEIGFYSGAKKQRDSFTGEEYEVKNVPKLMKTENEGIKVKYTYYSNIPFQEWKRRGDELETLFNYHIVKIELSSKSKQIITLHTVPADQGLGNYIHWDNKFVRLEGNGKFELVCGVSMLEEVVFDLVKNPHMLIAGLTGSGKSVLETCLAWQCIRKGARIFMVDFKGGMEFGLEYEAFGEVVTGRQRVIEVLRQLVHENTLRMALLRRERLKNLEEYNQKHPKNKLARVILLCDEVAEMLDKEGADKEEKKEMDEIAKLMSSIARLSRAPGINMILATQRPDAKVITGQIKANLPIRISGKMVDDYNSEMVLGNTKATEIDADIKGRFMFSMGVETHEFQAYAFSSSFLEPGKYQYGRMLIDGDNDISQDEIDSVLDEVEAAEIENEPKKKFLKNIFSVKKRPAADEEEEEPKRRDTEDKKKSYIELVKKTADKKQEPKAVDPDPVNTVDRQEQPESKLESKPELLETGPEAADQEQVDKPKQKEENKVVVDGREFKFF